jgi:hypothetical protein
MNAHEALLLAVGILSVLSLGLSGLVLVLEADLDRRINRLKDMLLSLEDATRRSRIMEYRREDEP